VRRIAYLVSALLAFSPSAGADILVGAAGPFSGQYAILGNHLKTGAEAAIAEINAKGGINGEALRLIAIDDGCDTKRAVEAAQQFKAQDVRLVVGHYCSGSAGAAALVYREAEILMISPSASQPALTEARQWNVFRLAGRDDAPFTMAAMRIAALSPQQPAAIVVSENLSSLVVGSTRLLPRAERQQIKTGTFDATSVASSLIAAGIKHLLIALTSADAAKLAAALQAQGFAGTIYGNEQLLAEAFVTRALDTSFEIRAAFPADPMANPLSAPVVEAFRAAGSEPEGATLPAYAAVQIFVEAAKARSVNDARAMADWMRSGQPFETALGPIAFDAQGDLARQPFTWYRWLGQAKRFAPE
jgi:branched-chain amino acid transport system substrate-binding protein